MEVLPKAKQIRFTQLIKTSGRPHAATLWVSDPSKDPDFKKAIDENRIVTIRSSNTGTKADRGIIGFIKGGNATYLIFPKPLSMSEGAAVIGLKFDQLESPEVKDPVKIKPAKRASKIEKVATAAETPKGRARRPRRAVNVPTPRIQQESSSAQKTAKQKPKPAPPSSPSAFTVTIQYTATTTRDFNVRAANATAAIEHALKKARSKSPGRIDWTTEALNVKKLD